jgi:hypothetical protein
MAAKIINPVNKAKKSPSWRACFLDLPFLFCAVRRFFGPAATGFLTVFFTPLEDNFYKKPWSRSLRRSPPYMASV